MQRERQLRSRGKQGQQRRWARGSRSEHFLFFIFFNFLHQVEGFVICFFSISTSAVDGRANMSRAIGYCDWLSV